MQYFYSVFVLDLLKKEGEFQEKKKKENSSRRRRRHFAQNELNVGMLLYLVPI